MKPLYTLSCTLGLLISGSVFAQGQAQPDTRLRDALRDATSQLRNAQTELTAVKAEVATALAEKEEAQTKAAALQKQVATEMAALDKSVKTLKAQTTEQAGELERLKKELEETRSALAATQTEGVKAEEERKALALARGQLEGRVSDLQSKNLKLYFLSKEILQRYEKHSFGKALAAKEPFIGQSKTKLENLIQEYQDKIDDNIAKR